jgi:hypothetical protein
VVDECGDTMSGDLTLGSNGIGFSSGLLTGTGGELRFGSSVVCRAGSTFAGCGDVQSVTAGSGLTGGGSSGAVTVSVATGGITGAHISPGTTITAANYQFSAPVTRSYVLSAGDFAPTRDTFSYSRGGPSLTGTPAGAFVSFQAGVHLPDGATITSMKAHVTDSDAAQDITVRLFNRPFTATIADLSAEVVTSSTFSGIQSLTDSSVLFNPVDNDAESTIAYIAWTVPASTSAIAFYDIVLTYTVPSPAP